AGAKKFYKTSMAYVKINYPDELKWVKGVTSRTFDRMTFQEFLGEYCWVVFAANFKVKTVEKHFPAIKRAFHNFSPKNVCDMKSPGPDFPTVLSARF
ncbi:MAG TPA: hypothetical protein VKU60_08490, partial [Chloroflexota bacterium]|nr:hypothetical protein [Chloroflexota bacterium]